MARPPVIALQQASANMQQEQMPINHAHQLFALHLVLIYGLTVKLLKLKLHKNLAWTQQLLVIKKLIAQRLIVMVRQQVIALQLASANMQQIQMPLNNALLLFVQHLMPKDGLTASNLLLAKKHLA